MLNQMKAQQKGHMACGLRGGPVAHVALVALLNSISENSYETRQFREIRV